MQVYKIKVDDIYHAPLSLIVGGTHNDLEGYIYKKYNKILECNASSDAMFFSIYNDKEHYYDMHYVWVENFNWTLPKQAILAHEILHFTFEIMRHAGIPLSRHSEEAYTYFFQSAFAKIWNKIIEESQKAPKIKKKA